MEMVSQLLRVFFDDVSQYFKNTTWVHWMSLKGTFNLFFEDLKDLLALIICYSDNSSIEFVKKSVVNVKKYLLVRYFKLVFNSFS